MRSDRREYIRTFNRVWIAKRRRDWVQANGPCRACGSSADLEVDHVDPATKRHEPRDIWSRRQVVRDAELAKCQVLCSGCHQKKTSAELYRARTHGTVAMYKRGNCRCDLCCEAQHRYYEQGRKNAASIFIRRCDLRKPSLLPRKPRQRWTPDWISA